jgi:hypothetical protein
MVHILKYNGHDSEEYWLFIGPALNFQKYCSGLIEEATTRAFEKCVNNNVSVWGSDILEQLVKLIVEKDVFQEIKPQEPAAQYWSTNFSNSNVQKQYNICRQTFPGISEKSVIKICGYNQTVQKRLKKARQKRRREENA